MFNKCHIFLILNFFQTNLLEGILLKNKKNKKKFAI